MPKRGHARVSTTLRPEEVDLLDNWTADLEAARQKRIRHPETYRPTDATKFTRMGMLRAAARFALEHRQQFEDWIGAGHAK
jgi:hypothetical protein